MSPALLEVDRLSTVFELPTGLFSAPAEIHAVADDKRGSHLALTLERLDALVTAVQELGRLVEVPTPSIDSVLALVRHLAATRGC